MTDFAPLITTTSISSPFPPVTAVPDVADQSPQLNGSLSDHNDSHSHSHTNNHSHGSGSGSGNIHTESHINSNSSNSNSNHAQEEEEEYTIKCICSYLDDDGNTVYCPRCDTWQHIECFYPSKKVPEEHYCADCLPRDSLDAKRATERQRRRREALDGGDRKIKRPPSSKTRKKHKDSISASTPDQLNGWHGHDRRDSLTNGRDQPPPAKKAKTSHRPSGSVASVNGGGGGGESRRRASSNAQNHQSPHYPSPSKSPPDQVPRYVPIPLYSPEFLDLYDRDEGSTVAQANEVTVQAMRLLSDWRNNPSRIAAPGQQPTNEVPFVPAPPGVDLVSNAKVTVETTQRKDLEIGGKIPRWKYVRTKAPLAKDEIVGEIRGEVGLLPEYCLQESTQNRWSELKHPDPFVFFHPHMNIYIDSRKEGTDLKYIRRSCLANVTLKTLVSEDGDIRHCFAARHDIAAGSELTAAWFLDPEMLLSGPDEEEPPFSRQAEWASRVLSNFGDCACPVRAKCHFANLDRRMPLKGLGLSSASAGSLDVLPPDKGKSGARRKKSTKTKPAASPISLGPGLTGNSRAGSEALKQEDDDQNDRHSTSPSTSTDAAKSRDITPVTVAALDADPVLGSDLTAREIRKIKAMEKLFEQTGSAKKDKKKRTSAGSNLPSPNPNSFGGTANVLANSSPNPNAKQSPHPTPGPIIADHFSPSPPPRQQDHQQQQQQQQQPQEQQQQQQQHQQQAHPRPSYTSIAIQTDPDEPEQVQAPSPPTKRRKYLTPTQKLLRKVLADRSKWEQECKQGVSPSLSAAPSPSLVQSASWKETPTRSQTVEMTDVGVGLSPATSTSASASPSPSESRQALSPLLAPPLPSQAAHSLRRVKVPALAPKLQLSLLPPVPAFSAAPPLSGSLSASAVASSATASTPSTTQSYSALSAGASASAVATPSPAKKKLTLGDYISRRNTNPTSTSEKPSGLAITEAVRKDSSGAGAEASQAIKEESPAKEVGSPMEDVVMKEAGVGAEAEANPEPEPEYTPPEGTTEAKTELATNASSTVSSVLASLTMLHEKQRRQSVGST